MEAGLRASPVRKVLAPLAAAAGLGGINYVGKWFPEALEYLTVHKTLLEYLLCLPGNMTRTQSLSSRSVKSLK